MCLTPFYWYQWTPHCGTLQVAIHLLLMEDDDDDDCDGSYDFESETILWLAVFSFFRCDSLPTWKSWVVSPRREFCKRCFLNAQSQYLLKCKLKLFSSSIVVFRFFHVSGSFQTISISDCFLTMSSANAKYKYDSKYQEIGWRRNIGDLKLKKYKHKIPTIVYKPVALKPNKKSIINYMHWILAEYDVNL